MSDQPKPALLFERYEILECLKKDDHTAVYVARVPGKPGKVVVKVLDIRNLPDESILERFKREAKVLSKINHKNIIRVIESGSDENQFYISFEYFESKNLRYYLRSQSLTFEQKKYIISQVIHGMNHAHADGIIHRDIKPENIFVSDSLKVKIGDFGLALAANENFITSQYSIVGTPTYMSPEQIRGERVTVKSDLFALGIVTYEVFSGKNPFLGKDINETLNKIMSFDENDFSYHDEIKSDVREVITSLLKRDPSSRQEISGSIFGIPEEEEHEHRFLFKVRDSRAKYIITLGIILIIASPVLWYLLTHDIGVFNLLNNSEMKKQDTLTIFQHDSLPLSTDQPKIESEKVTAKQDTITTTPNLTNEILNRTENKVTIPISIEKRKGTLFIECLPWAYVYIDSQKIDVTPLKSDLMLDEGDHFLQLKHPQYPIYSAVISISPSQLMSIKINLDTLFGYLECKIYPWGKVFIDGKEIGDTPFQSPVKVFPGEHKVLLQNNGFTPVEFSVRIRKNETYVLKHTFGGTN